MGTLSKITGTEPEPPTKPMGCICKPSQYVHEALDGTTDSSTARGKSQLLKGVQLPTGMLATEEDHSLGPNPEHKATICLMDEDQVPKAAMMSAPTADITGDNPRSLAEAKDCSDSPEWKKAIDKELTLSEICSFLSIFSLQTLSSYKHSSLSHMLSPLLCF